MMKQLAVHPLTPLLLTAILCGCAPSHHSSSENQKLGPTSMIYSPNGEPLNGGSLGRPKCEEAMSIWFGRVDLDHSGGIDHGEFIADAMTQFTRMDIDRNGYLLPEELERYRLPYRQDTTNNANSSSSDTDNGQHRHGRHGMPVDNNPPSNSGGGSQSITPDPVMSADTNNDFRVTLREYIAQADRRFAELDANHDGLISLDKLLTTCAPKSER